MVVRLPERAAVERAIVDGLPSEELREALDIISDDHDLKLDVDSIDDSDLADRCVWALKQKVASIARSSKPSPGHDTSPGSGGTQATEGPGSH
jgi:hypothetical protein